MQAEKIQTEVKENEGEKPIESKRKSHKNRGSPDDAENKQDPDL